MKNENSKNRRNLLTDQEMDIYNTFNFDVEVDITGFKNLSSLAKRLLVAIESEIDEESPHEAVEIGHKTLRARVCKKVRVNGGSITERLKPTITEIEEYGLIMKRSSYSVDEGKSYGYALTDKYFKASRVYRVVNRKPSGRRSYKTWSGKINLPAFEGRLNGGEYDLDWLNHLSLCESVKQLRDLKTDWVRLSRIALDVKNILLRKHRCSVGQTGRVYLLPNGICSELRKYLTLGGERLAEGDIKTCHPSLCSHFYGKMTATVKYSEEAIQDEKNLFLSNLKSSTDFYRSLMQHIPSYKGTRKDFKKDFNSWLNGKQGLRLVEDALGENYPILTQFVVTVNRKAKIKIEEELANFRIEQKLSKRVAKQRFNYPSFKPYLGSYTQKIESNVVCNLVFQAALQKGIPFIPIHDGFMCPSEKFTKFAKLIESGFKEKYGCEVTVEKEKTIQDIVEEGVAA
jgi:hypothetical protein